MSPAAALWGAASGAAFGAASAASTAAWGAASAAAHAARPAGATAAVSSSHGRVVASRSPAAAAQCPDQFHVVDRLLPAREGTTVQQSLIDVRLSPNSGAKAEIPGRQLRARKRHMQCSKDRASFNQCVSTHQKRFRDRKANGLGSSEIDGQLELRGLLYG
jgi:hypothetical protein